MLNDSNFMHFLFENDSKIQMPSEIEPTLQSGRFVFVLNGRMIHIYRGVFRTFELRVLTVIDCPKIAGANSPFFQICGCPGSLKSVQDKK